MITNPFEQHGIEYLSATQINEFITNPARWILWQTGFRDVFGSPAMWRGICVDNAIEKSLEETDMPIDELINYALQKFDIEFQMALDLNIAYDGIKLNKERADVETYVKIAVPYFRKMGKPIATQKRIELNFEELPIPIIGYLDLQYEGQVRDIKTVARLPANMMSSVRRQLAIYAAAEQCDAFVDYVHVTKTTQQVKSVPVENIDSTINEVRRACINMMNVCAYSNDINEVAQLFFPNFDDWKWSAAEIGAAKKIWRI